jgi:Rieske Fe-S protein
MKIVVVGGDGLIGSKLVATLKRDGHQVVAASRRSGFDAVSGEGLAEGLGSASVVIDVSNSPSFEDAAVMKFFKTATHNLLTCPLHGAQFNVWTGAVLHGPAKDPLKTYAVTVDGDVGCVVVPLAQAVQGA